QMVSRFHQNGVPVFLISLKAGGTGLNLTAADIVIHYDPWWNVAAQNQATDRTHRIGQEKQVMVYKLITSDTIEENILNLQEAKRNLADQIVTGGGISFGELTKADILKMIEESRP
ncbi:MAG: helicase-related protein, partial [Clostridium sp.]